MGKSQDFAYKWKKKKIDIAHRKKGNQNSFSIFSRNKGQIALIFISFTRFARSFHSDEGY